MINDITQSNGLKLQNTKRGQIITARRLHSDRPALATSHRATHARSRECIDSDKSISVKYLFVRGAVHSHVPVQGRGAFEGLAAQAARQTPVRVPSARATAAAAPRLSRRRLSWSLEKSC